MKRIAVSCVISSPNQLSANPAHAADSKMSLVMSIAVQIAYTTLKKNKNTNLQPKLIPHYNIGSPS